MELTSADGAITFHGSYGITSIRANELVWEGKTMVSRLIWRSDLMHTFNADVKAALPEKFYAKAAFSLGLGGDGYMADYDWFTGEGPWTHRSVHPDTRLDKYFTLSLEAGREVLANDTSALSIGAGVKYTDVKWSAYGGSYIYSDTGFRKDRGKFPDGEKGISYEQTWPVPYIGLSAVRTEGAWTFSGALQGGLSVNARGRDNHWMRDLLFVDHVKSAPVVMLSTSIDYAVTRHAAFYVSGSFDRMFRSKADTTATALVDDSKSYFKNGAGADYRSITVSFGLKGTF